MCSTENSAQIKRKDLKAHENICPLVLVTCLFCNKHLSHSLYQFHKDKLCPEQYVRCKYCHIFGPHDEINGSHVKECGDYPTGCPRGCKNGEKLKQKELKQHAMECELEPVKCAFFDAGCRVMIPWKDLMESSTQNHLQNCLELQFQMANDYQKLVTFFTELKGNLTSYKPIMTS